MAAVLGSDEEGNAFVPLESGFPEVVAGGVVVRAMGVAGNCSVVADVDDSREMGEVGVSFLLEVVLGVEEDIPARTRTRARSGVSFGGSWV